MRKHELSYENRTDTDNSTELLAPLTCAADLPNHPGYSQAYTSKHLTNLTSEAGEISRKEQVTLARAKFLFTKLTGDPSFVPISIEDLHSGEKGQDPWVDPVSPRATSRQANGQPEQIAHPEATGNGHRQETPAERDVAMEDAEQHDQQDGAPHPTTENGEPADGPEPITNGANNANGGYGNSSHHNPEGEQQDGQQQLQPNGDEPHSPHADDASDTASQQTAHRMTTRNRGRAAQAPDPTPPASPSSSAPPIHPLFTYQTDSRPDRDLGLPSAEADLTRMVLLAFIQKQEEIARAATDLYMGMLQGERMRHEVYGWSKAEAHAGEMSDGEDWYDQEWWGLDGELAKGKEEEEEPDVPQGKKSTRQRRGKDKGGEGDR